jgi:undecaprenyl-diphosphatase
VDEAVLLGINGLRAPALDAVLGPIGEWALYLYPAVLIALVIWKRREMAPTARDGLLAWLATLFVTESILKPLIRRARPTSIPEVLARLHVLGEVPSARSLSMPSGTAAACAAGAAWLWLRLGPRAGIPAALLAALASVARIYAGIHWPSDVLAGAAVGVAIALAVARFADWAGSPPKPS